MKKLSSNQLVILLALALDLALGEPPNALHPVAWIGSLIGALERRAPHDQPRRELIYGAGMTVVSLLAMALPVFALQRSRKSCEGNSVLGSWFSVLACATLLKPAFAGRALFQAVAAVRRPLAAGDLGSARLALRSLVSRDPSQLDAALIAAAAIESLAENASDSFVAPLFYYSSFGLPSAWVYRAVNTLDAMVGYHGRYEYLGKVAARLDDVLNLVPARLTALLIAAAAGLAGADARQSCRALRRDHARTASPNAGYPISAIAGALGIRLEKVDHYCLNDGGRAPQPEDITQAERVVALALAIAAGLCVGVRQRR
jgi:adenosylcobinamide-phosphate synthase